MHSLFCLKTTLPEYCTVVNSHAGMEVKSYSYYNLSTCGLNAQGLYQDLAVSVCVCVCVCVYMCPCVSVCVCHNVNSHW